MTEDKSFRDKMLHVAGKHYAAAYLLMTIALDHVDSGDDAAKALGLYRHGIKQLSSRTQKAHEAFCKDFQRYLASGDDKVILSDYEQLTEEINKVLDLKL